MIQKEARVEIDKIVISLIVILVVASVLFFIFKSGFISLLKNIPSPSPETPENISQSKKGADNNVCLSKDVVGIIKGEYIYVNGERTDFVWKGGQRNAEIFLENIYFDESGASPPIDLTTKIGVVRKGVVAIDKAYLNSVSDSRTYDLAKSIDNSYYYGNNILCKKNEA